MNKQILKYKACIRRDSKMTMTYYNIPPLTRALHGEVFTSLEESAGE